MKSVAKPLEPWERLLKSHDIYADLAEIYPDAFYDDLARLFDKSPYPFELINGVQKTARAYVDGKWRKRIVRSQLLKFTGVHLMKAGQAAQQLEASLEQLQKSAIGEAALYKRLEKYLKSASAKGQATYSYERFRNGPDNPLSFIRELSGALALAANEIIPLPDKDEPESVAESRAKNFVEPANKQRRQNQEKLAAHYALEQAAAAFQPTWEQFSTKPYQRGRYHHDKGGYYSEPVIAFHRIIAQIDSRVVETLVGTAINNVLNAAKVV